MIWLNCFAGTANGEDVEAGAKLLGDEDDKEATEPKGKKVFFLIEAHFFSFQNYAIYRGF